jgi:hypothetical protein
MYVHNGMRDTFKRNGGTMYLVQSFVIFHFSYIWLNIVHSLINQNATVTGIIFSTSYNIGKLIYSLYGAILDSYQENLVVFGSESCRSCQEPGNDSCNAVYQ